MRISYVVTEQLKPFWMPLLWIQYIGVRSVYLLWPTDHFQVYSVMAGMYSDDMGIY